MPKSKSSPAFKAESAIMVPPLLESANQFTSFAEPTGHDDETHQQVDSADMTMTTAHGMAIADNQNSLRADPRRTTLLEDIILRENVFHFEHERTPAPISDGYYVQGLMVFDVPNASQAIAGLRHTGGTAGASAIVLHSPKNNAFVAVAVIGDGQATPVANLLLDTVTPTTTRTDK